MASPIEEIHERYKQYEHDPTVKFDQHTREMWNAIKAELALREKAGEKEAPLVDWPPTKIPVSRQIDALRYVLELFEQRLGDVQIARMNAAIKTLQWLQCDQGACDHDTHVVEATKPACDYTENSVDFPTPGHVMPEITGTDRPHLVSTECECCPTLQSLTEHDGSQKKVWVHRKRNFTRWA